MRNFAWLFLILLLAAGCAEQPAADDESDPDPVAAAAPPVGAGAKGRIQFVQGYRAGYEQATREGKPMLVFFTASWCEYCHQMARESFVAEQVVDLSQRFVCILVDADRELEVCRQFQVRSYPTIQFLSPWGTPLNRVVGKKPGHQLVIEMHTALQSLARRQVREPAAAF